MFASLMCKTQNIVLIDANSTLAPKLKISGGGKCNVTNEKVSADNFFGDAKFVANILEKFSNIDLINFLKNIGVETKKVARVVDGQFFCNSSKEIISAFEKMTKSCDFLMNTKVLDAEFKNDLFEITCDKNKIYAKKLLIASGGLSYAQLNATSIGFEIAKKFGHTVVLPTPALVGLTVQPNEFWFKNLSGVSLEASVLVGDKKFAGGLLFAHKGISGPVILNASLWWSRGLIDIDFLPKVKNLDKFLETQKAKIVSNAINLPKNFMKVFLDAIGLEDKKVSEFSKDEIIKLHKLKNYTFAPAGTFGFTKAEVTKGGVDTSEIDHQTFESKNQKNLYFLGEVLNVTGELGGYNLQWAFSSAKVCADNF